MPDDSQPPVPVEKPPTETAVTYAFSTDAGLREQVGRRTLLQLRIIAALLYAGTGLNFCTAHHFSLIDMETTLFVGLLCTHA